MQHTAENPSQPQTTAEFYKYSFGEVLSNNLGVYVTCEFLIGSNSLLEKSGILFDVGVNFVTLYEDELDRYVTCDLYSLKFVTFYTTRPGSPAMQPPQRPMPRGNGRG